MSDSLVTHSQMVLSRVNALRHNRKLCDVILIAGDMEIFGHRAILAACSSYFEAMFSTGMLESREEKILIQEMDSGVLGKLIDFAYTGDIELTADNVLELLSASSRLQMDAVQNLCCDYLREQLDAHNCLEIRSFAEQYGCSNLTEVRLYCNLFTKTLILTTRRILIGLLRRTFKRFVRMMSFLNTHSSICALSFSRIN